MPEIRQILAPDSISYSWNTPQWIVIHYTADTGSAYNNAVYFSRGGNWNSSAHYFIDGKGIIYQSVPESRGAWHAGNYQCNTHSIGIETVSAGQDFTSAEIEELAWLVQKLMSKYGIDENRVIRHYDVVDYFSGNTADPHKNCPAPYINNAKWQELKATITGDDNMTDEQIQKLANKIAEAQMNYAAGEDKKAQWSADGKGKGTAYRNNYNLMRWILDTLWNISAKLDKILGKLD